MGALYSREFYALARTRLRQGGYISQWLPAYQVPAAATLAMVRAFIEVFPQLQDVLTSSYLRGAVSGLGVLNIGAGIAELVALFAARARGTSSTNSEFRIQNSETPLR